MLGTRINLAAIIIAVAAAIVLLAIMDRCEAVNQLADRLRQHFVGEIHVGEHGVTTPVGRHFSEMEDRAHRRLRVARYVGVPVFAGNILGFVVRLDNENLGMIRNHIRRRRVHVQLAEAAPKIFLLFDAKLLVAEKDDEAVHERVIHFLELLIAERLGQVDAKDFRTNVRSRLADFDGLVIHGISLTGNPPSAGLR